MKLSNSISWLLIAFLLTHSSSGLYAQEQSKSSGYEPLIIQEGKDVPWVPTPEKLVDKMLEMANVSADDYLIDLGSGDGRMVIAAAKLGARALGIEFNPDMVEYAKRKAEEAGVGEKTEFIKADFFEYDFSEATVITLFLLPSINLDLRPRLLELKPGIRIVSNTFSMGAWEPDYEATTLNEFEVTAGEYMAGWNKALMWIIPAKVEGSWKLRDGQLNFLQDFQMFHGTYQSGNKTVYVSKGRIEGYNISFTVNGAKYTGRLTDDHTLEGTVTTGENQEDWIATRVENQVN
jgi:SAM-dependent methyltransferase